MNPNFIFFVRGFKKKITNKTKGILWVHVTGLISQEYKIIKFAKDNKLFIIEDAHAQGSSINQIQAETWAMLEF